MPTRYRKLSTKKRKHPKRRLKTKRLSKRLFRKNTRRGRSKKTRRYRKRRGGMMGTRHQSFGSAIKTHNTNLTTRCNTLEDYATLRNALEQYGVEKFHQTETVMGGKNLFSGDKLNINGSPNPEPPTGRLPFTFFTVMKFANGEDQQLIPKQLQDKYIILRNKPEFGGSPGTDWDTAKQMILHQCHNITSFVGVKAMDWDKFNALTFGYGPGGVDESLQMLDELEAIANTWATARGIPSHNLGCYFHIYPFNSVQSLHMHMVDTRPASLGAAWAKNTHKNMPLEMVRRYLRTHAGYKVK